ncbi:MAG: SH3 domain-containing protein [Actinomycetota bacterium]|nr:SH3 domain-containing protein [Actinomycetota bacterium]
MRVLKTCAVTVVVSLVVVACGGVEPAATTTTQPPISTTSTEIVPTSTTSTTLPGEVIDFGPMEGDVLMVIGVRHDDVLNLRSGPGIDQDIVGEMAADFKEMIALGETRQIPDAFWIAVEIGGMPGWVNMRYIGYEGATDDLTSQVVADLGGIPMADTMVELGLLVVETMASEDPASDIVVVVDETVGDLGEVTYDVVGLGDDAVRGLRVHVFGQPSADGFSLKSVEVTTICGRGISPDGLCP